jgi:vacuolar-type H+-ATPase subunit E/Vma4
MSTTIEDKINLFANVIFERVEKQSEEKFAQARKQIEDNFSAEKEKIEAIARQVEEDKVKKSDTTCTQILSRARMEAKQSLFQKKEELLNRTIGTLRDHAREFVKAPEYESFLRKAICRTISGLAGEKLLLFSFTSDDLKNHADLIRKTVVDCLADSSVVYTLHEAEYDIIGGCSCSNELMTKRSVYTMASLLEDNRDRIGEIVMENLQVQVVS